MIDAVSLVGNAKDVRRQSGRSLSFSHVPKASGQRRGCLSSASIPAQAMRERCLPDQLARGSPQIPRDRALTPFSSPGLARFPRCDDRSFLRSSGGLAIGPGRDDLRRWCRGSVCYGHCLGLPVCAFQIHKASAGVLIAAGGYPPQPSNRAWAASSSLACHSCKCWVQSNGTPSAAKLRWKAVRRSAFRWTTAGCSP